MTLDQVIIKNQTIFRQIDSIVVFGSTVRGDTDDLSDQDVLLVSSKWTELLKAKEFLSKLNFSCSCYSWKKLAYLNNTKALFLQHLKTESRIIKDNDNQLNKLLSLYKPAFKYRKEFNQTKELISLTEYFPNTFLGIGWALDILAVAFRNFGILTLANHGRYIFSYSELIDTLIEQGYLNEIDRTVLLDLRMYKSFYRQRKFSNLPPKKIVFLIQSILSNTFKLNLTPRVITKQKFENYCLFSNKAQRTTNWYFQTRLYEGAFLSWLGTELFYTKSERILNVLNVIENPCSYTFYGNLPFGTFKDEIISLIFQSGRRAA